MDVMKMWLSLNDLLYEKVW